MRKVVRVDKGLTVYRLQFPVCGLPFTRGATWTGQRVRISGFIGRNPK
jgi:hypothetical protein